MQYLVLLLISFIGILFLSQIIFFEIGRKNAIKNHRYNYFANLNKPFSYNRTLYMVVICVVCYMISGGRDLSSTEWFLYLLIFVAAGVISDAISQYLALQYARIRSKKQIAEYQQLNNQVLDLENFTEDHNYEVSLPIYDEISISKKYLKPSDHLSFLSIDHGAFASNFGTYPEVTYDVEPYGDISEIKESLEELGIKVTTLTESKQMPFKDDRIDILINEYANYKKEEIKRVIKPGGYFICNQYGTDNLKEFIQMYLPFGIKGVWDKENCINTLKELNMSIEESYEDKGYMRFRNINQLHTYLCQAMPDIKNNYEKYNGFYMMALNDIHEKGFFELTTYRFLVVAKIL